MKTLYTLVFVLSITIGAFAQGSKLNKADKKYDKYSYIDAIEIYEKVAEKGYKSVEIFEKLGNAYYFNGELDNITVLYGGSVNADNADSFAADSMIDGALVGGASLKAESFLAIAKAFGGIKA